MGTVTVKTRRRRTPPKAPVLGKVTWAVLDSTGAVLRENSYGPGATLAMAQRLVGMEPEETYYIIERRNLFGPPAQLYRVVRAESGNVWTVILSNED